MRPMNRRSLPTLVLSLALSLPLVLLGARAVEGSAGKPVKASAAYAEQVRAAVDQHLEELAPCMDANKTRRGTRVKLQVQVMILSDGSVLSARRGGKGKPADAAAAVVEGCMLGKVKKWRFPSPADRQTVAVEFPIEMEMAK